MDDIRIGQSVLINGFNAKRKAAEGIPIKARGEVFSISHAPNRPTIYNVQTANGAKYGLFKKEFNVLNILPVPMVPSAEPKAAEPEAPEANEGLETSEAEGEGAEEES